MPTSKKPRKKYKKQPKLFTNSGLPSVFGYSDSAERALMIIPHQELERLRTGTADESTWHTVTMRLNWGFFLACDHFCEDEPRQLMLDALNFMRSIEDRHNRLGKWGVSGDELLTIGRALNVIDEMQINTTRREQERSLNDLLKINNTLNRRIAEKERELEEKTVKSS